MRGTAAGITAERINRKIERAGLACLFHRQGYRCRAAVFEAGREIDILFESKPLAEGLADWFDANKARIAYRVSLDESHCDNSGPCEGRLRWTEKDGKPEVVYLKDPRTGAITRFAVALVALLPIEGQL